MKYHITLMYSNIPCTYVPIIFKPPPDIHSNGIATSVSALPGSYKMAQNLNDITDEI